MAETVGQLGYELDCCSIVVRFALDEDIILV